MIGGKTTTIASARAGLSLPRCLSTGIVCLCVLVAVPRRVHADQPQPYVDRLIEPSTGDDAVDPVYQQLMEQPPGHRFLGLEVLHYAEDRDAQGIQREDGLALNWRRETLNYGELEAEASVTGVSDAAAYPYGPGSGGMLTLRQHDFAPGGDWVMQNSLGVDRTTVDGTLANSYRIKLPSSLIAGFNTRLASGATALQFSAGRLGRLNTGQVQSFDDRSGNLLMAGLSRDLSAQVRAGLELVRVDGLQEVPDHRSVAGVVQYRNPGGDRTLQGHFLADSEGAAGGWIDGSSLLGRWQHHYGIFRIAPDTLWTDVPVTDDQQGVYLRSDLRLLRYQLGGGFDYTASNIDHDPARTSTRSRNLYLNASRRLDRLTSIGATFNVRELHPYDSTTDPELLDSRLSVFTAHNFPLGTTRVQLEAAAIRNGSRHGRARGVTWDQFWNVGSSLNLSSTLGYEAERDTGNDATRIRAGFLLNQDFDSTLRWDASISWTRSRDELADTSDDSVNGSLALAWHFLPAWEASLRALVNDYSQQAGSAGTSTDFSGRDRSLLLSVHYARSSGRPFDRYGRDTGKTGYGVITGVVFFDENRDGVRQATETPASGVYVYLDGRYQQATDRDGRFVYDPVPAGDHTLSIAQEDLPLPWGLADEHPGKVSVGVRERRTIAIPLVRSDE
jgi:hypothetical protein